MRIHTPRVGSIALLILLASAAGLEAQSAKIGDRARVRLSSGIQLTGTIISVDPDSLRPDATHIYPIRIDGVKNLWSVTARRGERCADSESAR